MEHVATMESKKQIIKLDNMFVNYIPITWSSRKIIGNKRTIEDMDNNENGDGDEREIEKQNALSYR